MGSSITVKAGEVFSIANVKAWDANIAAARTFDAQFTVIADATSDSAGSIDLIIFPAIVAADGTSDVNDAHATVDSVPANGAVVTFLGSASTTYTPRLMYHRDSITLHSRPLMMPYTGRGFRRSLATAESEMRQGVIPLMPRLWFDSTFATGRHDARVDLFCEAQPRDRWMGIKFFGS